MSMAINLLTEEVCREAADGKKMRQR